ncbi:MAG: minichromosome maintenance protein MCM [Candidatus Bathyarchaeia archaeon]
MTVLTGPEERFQEFLRTFQPEKGEYKYRKKLGQLRSLGQNYFVVDFEDLVAYDLELARLIVDKPDEYLPYIERSGWAQLKIEDPQYAEEIKKIRVRYRKLPDRFSLRKVGQAQLSKLLLVDGIIVRSTPVRPLVTRAAFQCRKCNSFTFVEQSGLVMREPELCGRCRSKLLDFSEKQSTFINSQELRMQERPEDLPPGQLPRAIDVKLFEDLVDVARPGDRISLTGIVRAEQEVLSRGTRLRTFDLFIDANFLDISGKESEIVEITAEEEAQILEMAKDPWIHRKLLSSLAPSIYGYDAIKEAILYLLFGAVHKVLPDGVTIRGDVNVLLIGDPGTAKSQLLQYVARVAPRGLYTSGRGSTAAGLTAAVVREKSGGLVLEAGALVLADKGVCSIDEIDKMRPDDRVAIHEAMEQQTVSIAKGGIVATLNARASVLAAANPALGRYEPYKNITENINLPVTILSRFDLIFIMRDAPDVEVDTKMSEHILTLHRVGAPPQEVPLTPQMFRKYVSYARGISPVLTEEASNALRDFYLRMRSTSTTADSPIAITPRQLEALVRLSECRARSFLRDKVTVEDTDAIIRLMTISLQHVGIDTSTGKVDIDTIMTGKPKSLRDRMQTILSTVATMERETGAVQESKLYEELSKTAGLSEGEVQTLVNQLIRDGILYSPKPGHLKRTAA